MGLTASPRRPRRSGPRWGVHVRRGAADASIRAVVLALALVFVHPTGSASAQAMGDTGWTVVSARFDADLEGGDGSAAVTVSYTLSGTPRGAPLPLDRPFRVTLLEVGDASVSRFSVNGGEPVEIGTTQGRQRAADIMLTPDADGEEVLVALTYRVTGAVVSDGVELRAQIPVLAGPSAPEAGEGGGFEARVAIPPGWRIAEGFPSGLGAESPGVLTAALQVTPAFVGFRGRSDGAWRPGVPLLVDLIMVLILGAFATLGVRHLRGVVK